MSVINSRLVPKKIGVAVIRNGQGKILIDRRLSSSLMGGLWEFPGGKIEAGETVPECIVREIKEELGIKIEINEHLLTINHDYSEFKVTLIVYLCHLLKGEPQPLECEEIRWVEISELSNFTFPKANQKIITALEVMEGVKI
jgi:mutator protein MutT